MSERRPATLRLRSVTRRFGPVTALDAVGLDVHSGEIVGIVGENGAGKTTVVRCAAGALRPDAGTVEIDGRPLGRDPADPRRRGVAVVWQDLGLCADLDVVANVFLGAEVGRVVLAEARMEAAAREVLERLGAGDVAIRAPVGRLSRARQQLVAIARALTTPPHVLLLDEPTAALSATASAHVAELLRQLRDRGTAILLASHDIDALLDVADRLVVLRAGRVVTDLPVQQAHRDEVLALVSGIEMGAMARHQLTRLQSLVHQLSAVEPATSLTLIISAMSAALDQDLLCLHLWESDRLRRAAAVGLPDAVLAATAELPSGPQGGPVGRAAATGELVVAQGLADESAWGGLRDAAAASGIRSMWAVPIVGRKGVLGTISGYAAGTGGLRDHRRDLVAVYAGQAAGAIEREQLLHEITRRKEVLESLRGILERLAGPERLEGGLAAALLALCRSLAADGVALHVLDGGGLARRADVETEPGRSEPDADPAAIREVALAAEGQARRLTACVVASPLRLPEGPGVLVAWWGRAGAITPDGLELIDDACRSLALALEREALEAARREAAGLRRSQALQRELLSRLSHELRTPLTAIQGYASTLRQPSVHWDAAAVDRFLTAIAGESGRMERLVDDLLDSSAIESGLLRLQRDWCDLALVLGAARDCLAEPHRVHLHPVVAEPVWGDHDRLEQVFVNLLENAVRHGGGDVGVTVASPPRGGVVTVTIADEGPGVPPELAERIFEPRFRGVVEPPGAGLGLSIARGIVEAHGGALTLVASDRGATFRVELPTEPPTGTAEDEARWELIAAIDEARHG